MVCTGFGLAVVVVDTLLKFRNQRSVSSNLNSYMQAKEKASPKELSFAINSSFCRLGFNSNK